MHGPQAGQPPSGDWARGEGGGPVAKPAEASALWAQVLGQGRSLREPVGALGPSRLYPAVGCDVRPAAGVRFIRGDCPETREGCGCVGGVGGPCLDSGEALDSARSSVWGCRENGTRASKLLGCGLRNHPRECLAAVPSVTAPTGSHERVLEGLGPSTG